MKSRSLARLTRCDVIYYLWFFEAMSVVFGVIAVFVMQYLMHMTPCMLCMLDRWIWVLYALLLWRAWSLEGRSKQFKFWQCVMRAVRYVLIAISIFHLEIIKGTFDFCMSPELMALRGGFWAYLASFNFRGCDQEPLLFGLLQTPICLLLVYIYWELSDLVRSDLRKKGSEHV